MMMKKKTGGIKKEAGKSSNKDVKKAEKTGGVKKEVGESSKRDVKKAEEIAESTRGDKLKSKRCEGGETSKKKKKKMKSNNVEHTVPVFSVTLTASYLKFLLVRSKTKYIYIYIIHTVSVMLIDFLFFFSQSQDILLRNISRISLRGSPFITRTGTVHGRCFAW